jgi:ribosome-associated toxin RatA of RatAB toxin-antitoxin module
MAFNVNESIDVAASSEEIFEVATDFESYPEWNGAMKRVEVKERDDEGRATKVFFEVDARLKTVRYTLSYDYSNAPEGFSWSLLEGDVKRLRGAYSFDEFDDVTEVSYELELDPGFPVPGIFRRQAERELKKAALDELKDRVESRG